MLGAKIRLEGKLFLRFNNVFWLKIIFLMNIKEGLWVFNPILIISFYAPPIMVCDVMYIFFFSILNLGNFIKKIK